MMDPVIDVVTRIKTAVSEVVVGNEHALEQILVAVFCGGHVLIEDMPGVGKTLLARSVSAAMGCTFRRVQFTPDVLPSDITGSTVFNQQTAEFELRPGPVFTQVLLADEINRATPRTQAALLEAMEEGQVTVEGTALPLSQPFLVLATQNPIELEGTFPLPEAQLDRFLIKAVLGYPTLQQEHVILSRFEADDPLSRLKAVVSSNEVLELRAARGRVRTAAALRDYVIALVRATREDPTLAVGASPRATLALHRASQARAMIHGRDFVIPDDVKALAECVLVHRLIVSTSARLRGVSASSVLQDVLERVRVPVEDNPESPDLDRAATPTRT